MVISKWSMFAKSSILRPSARGVLGTRRSGGTENVERPACQGREEERHRRAGAQPDGHVVFNQIRCRFRGDLLLPLDAHDVSAPEVGCGGGKGTERTASGYSKPLLLPDSPDRPGGNMVIRMFLAGVNGTL